VRGSSNARSTAGDIYVAEDGGNSRLYLSSQRGTAGSSSGGITYEIAGPFCR
jgi:hypothetical protein